MAYETVNSPFPIDLSAQSKMELREYYKWYMEILPQRVKELAEEVINSKGFETWTPDYTPTSLKLLGRWFASEVQIRKRTSAEIRKIESQSNYPIEISDWELTHRTFSIAFDIGLYISQVFLRNHPSLKWDQLLKSKRFVGYGQPVLVSFSTGPFEPVGMIITSAYGLASGERTEDDLIEIYKIWAGMIKQ